MVKVAMILLMLFPLAGQSSRWSHVNNRKTRSMSVRFFSQHDQPAPGRPSVEERRAPSAVFVVAEDAPDCRCEPRRSRSAQLCCSARRRAPCALLARARGWEKVRRRTSQYPRVFSTHGYATLCFMTDTESQSPEPTPRTPRAQVQRRLLAAAARVFAERGYADSRLEDIARAAGFTKGAVYSNFGSKQALFGALLGERADTELATVMAEIRDIDEASAAAVRAAQLVARRIVEDTERGRLGLEFAARAARDEETRAVVAPLRRAQRAAASQAFAEVIDGSGIQPGVRPELAGLILHCLTNGLAMERGADPETLDAEIVEEALSATLAGLLALPANG
ncbi:TetR/AcrR family transcriptional regulator [Streptomyces sp. AA1529]|uniref:TetR/AcrR family transcriptional regulator n=2 Tax=Streptomyces sp. AA1529 TaxID=1203257 RepID=UPI003EBB28AC